MTQLFADALADLRYDGGIVSFRLHASTVTTPGTTVHLRFSDFAGIIGLLASEVPKIEVVHRNWLEGEVAEPSPQAPAAESPTAIGKKIASV